MALITRNIQGYLFRADGTTIASQNIKFTLVDETGRPTAAWDAITFERVVGTKIVTTDANGYLDIALWATDRGDIETYYKCECDTYGFDTLTAPLPYAASAISFSDWANLGTAPLQVDSIYITGASNRTKTTGISAGPTSVDSIDVTQYKATEWILYINDSTASTSSLTRILALDENGTPIFTRYATVGTLTTYTITVTIASNRMHVNITNSGANDIDVVALRIPILTESI